MVVVQWSKSTLRGRLFLLARPWITRHFPVHKYASARRKTSDDIIVKNEHGDNKGADECQVNATLTWAFTYPSGVFIDNQDTWTRMSNKNQWRLTQYLYFVWHNYTKKMLENYLIPTLFSNLSSFDSAHLFLLIS